MDMLVSIITVCYNSEKTIRRTLESVLEQTYHKIEYIIVDGKSTDATLGAVNKFAVYTRLKEVFQDNPVGVWLAQIQW